MALLLRSKLGAACAETEPLAGSASYDPQWRGLQANQFQWGYSEINNAGESDACLNNGQLMKPQTIF